MTMTGADVITFVREHPDQVLAALIHEHRTFQQATVKSVHAILKDYAGDAQIRGTDLRNQDAVAWAEKVTREEVYFPFL
jgi:hypothetical protein